MQDIGELKAFVKECTEKYENDDEYVERLTNEVEKVVFQAEDTIEKYIVYKSRQKHRRTIDKTFHMTEYWGELRAVGKECKQVSEKMKELYRNKMPIAIKEIGNAAAGSTVKKRRIHRPVEDNFIGFEDVAEEVKKLLTGDSENLEVLSIVGMVGLGKTTLARKVYHDPEVEYTFFARAFVSVSQVYDRKEVFLKILNHFVAITDEISKMHVDSIRDKIHDELKGKQYLIVMDDVWEEAAWDDFVEVFPKNQRHSRVLITTRDNGVARHANPSVDPYLLRFMKDDGSKELLRWKVFGNVGYQGDIESHIKKYECLILEKRKWIAEGFIHGRGNLEDIAERYLEELVDRNLVMVAESKWNGQIKKCLVHEKEPFPRSKRD